MGRLLSVALNQSILGPEMKDSEIVHGQVSSLLCSSPRPMGVQPSPSCSQGDAVTQFPHLELVMNKVPHREGTCREHRTPPGRAGGVCLCACVCECQGIDLRQSCFQLLLQSRPLCTISRAQTNYTPWGKKIKVNTSSCLWKFPENSQGKQLIVHLSPHK